MTLALLIAAVTLQVIVIALILVRRPAAPDLSATHEKIDASRRELIDMVRKESEIGRTSANAAAAELRDDMRKAQAAFAEAVTSNLRAVTDAQRSQLDAFALRLDALTNSLTQASNRQREEVATSLRTFNESMLRQLTQSAQLHQQASDKGRLESAAAAKTTREEIQSQLKLISDTMTQRQADLSAAQKTQLEALAKQVSATIESSQQQAELLRQVVEKQLSAVREDNQKQLEQMRATVDEKLQGTLEKRLGESFKQVSDRLELVHRGLGEMQSLASGVGDLKKVLSNVKVRGNWGEVQLGNLLEQMLTSEQFGKNVAVTGEGRDRVEFAVKLPGKSDDDRPVWLPIDAKFPQADYQRLVDASERADVEAVEAAAKALADSVWLAAKTIRDKYIQPPQTTDFGILFLPTEGLYAEVLRRPGLADKMQRDLRIIIAGPTTLTALLNSLQMGFHTLAIQKQSGEVSRLLGHVKGDFEKFSTTLKSVKSKLDSASSSIEQAQKRTEIIGKRLRKAGELSSTEDAPSLLPPPARQKEDEEGGPLFKS